jgi:hypothetical protein
MNIEYAKAIRESFEKMTGRINHLETSVHVALQEFADGQTIRDIFFRKILKEVQHQQKTLRSKTDVELVEMIQNVYEKLSERIDNLEEEQNVR